MIALRILLASAVAAFIVALSFAGMTFWYFLPTIEAAVNPVIDVEACNVSTDREFVDGESKTRVNFSTCYIKYRPCPLANVAWVWLLSNDSILPAIVYNEAGEQFRPETRLPTTRFLPGGEAKQVTGAPFHTYLPIAAYSYREIALHGTLEYQCRPGAPLLYDVTVAVAIPANEPWPLPKAAPQEKTGFLPALKRLAWSVY